MILAQSLACNCAPQCGMHICMECSLCSKLRSKQNNSLFKSCVPSVPISLHDAVHTEMDSFLFSCSKWASADNKDNLARTNTASDDSGRWSGFQRSTPAHGHFAAGWRYQLFAPFECSIHDRKCCSLSLVLSGYLTSTSVLADLTSMSQSINRTTKEYFQEVPTWPMSQRAVTILCPGPSNLATCNQNPKPILVRTASIGGF